MRVQSKQVRSSCFHAAELSEVVRRSASPAKPASILSSDPHEITEENDTEELLLRRWRAGDRAAGDELIALCKPVLFWFFRRRTDENVEELVQGTLAACIQAIDSFEGRSSFKTFLLGIANKQFLMNLRANRQQARPVEFSSFHAPSPSQEFAVKERAQSVSAALSSMPLAFRRVLRMFYWGGFSVEEIARILEMPTGTVKSRLARGRTMLRSRMVATSRAPSSRTDG